MRAYIEKQIAERRERLQGNERERLTLMAELRSYEDMLHRLIAEETGGQPDQQSPTTKSPSTAFGITEHWLHVLQSLETHGRSFNAADVIAAASEIDFTPSTANVRSQIAHYAKRGHIRRISRGRYAFTARGRERLREGEGSGDETPEPSSRSVGTAGSPGRDPHQVPPVGSTPTVSTPSSPNGGDRSAHR